MDNPEVVSSPPVDHAVDGGLGDPTAVQRQIHEQFAGLASSLAGLLGELPPKTLRAPDLVRLLRIDNPLACRVLRVAQAADPAEAVEFMPTLNQVRRVIDRAAELAPGPVADRAKDAMARFDALVNELGIDQRGFESLVSSLSPKGVRRIELQHRRAAYRANAHLWGVNAEAVVSLMVLLPSRTRDSLDLHAVLGFVGARITRPGSVIMFGSRLRREGVSEESLSQDSARISASDLMADFSTIKDASFVEVTDKKGFRGTRVQFKGVRPKDAETIFVRRYVPSFAKTNTSERCASNTMVLWPCGQMHKDMLVPSGLTDPGTLYAEAYARRDDPRRAFEQDPEDRIPLREAPLHTAGVRELPGVEFYPRLGELFESIAGEHLSAGMSFDLYRSAVAFPMLHSLQCLRVDHIPRASV